MISGSRSNVSLLSDLSAMSSNSNISGLRNQENGPDITDADIEI